LVAPSIALDSLTAIIANDIEIKPFLIFQIMQSWDLLGTIA
jgi:hypothetical protein